MDYFRNFYFMNAQTLNFTNLIPDNKYITMELNMYVLIQFFYNQMFQNVINYYKFWQEVI